MVFKDRAMDRPPLGALKTSTRTVNTALGKRILNWEIPLFFRYPLEKREVVPYKTHRESLTDEEIQQDLSRAFAILV